MADIKPKFQVEKLEGKQDRKVLTPKREKDGKLVGGFEEEIVQEDTGWMIYLPSGTSFRVSTEAEMKRLGFFDDPSLVDMDSGDVVGTSGTNLKTLSEQKTSRGRRSSMKIGA